MAVFFIIEVHVYLTVAQNPSWEAIHFTADNYTKYATLPGTAQLVDELINPNTQTHKHTYTHMPFNALVQYKYSTNYSQPASRGCITNTASKIGTR